MTEFVFLGVVLDSTIDDIQEVRRFRILCVGRSGVGKSSVINHILLRVGLPETSVTHWNIGKADIEEELGSDENKYFLLHDSMGFEAGDTRTFDIVSEFVNRRRDKSLPLKDRLHVIWLCTEAPTAGGRVFETGDEKLLQLAHQTETPVVVVFTKYDRLLRSKRLELEGNNDGPDSNDLVERSNEEARKVLESCVKSLTGAMNRFKMQMPRYAEVSVQPGYEAHMSSLIEITLDIIQEKFKGDAWAIWAIAQRESLQLKIDLCIASAGTEHYRRFFKGIPRSPVLLLTWLAEIHQDLITCWNFKDDDKILSNDEFKQLMQYLVQDIQESLDRGHSRYTSSPAKDKIFQFLDQITTPPITVSLFKTTSDFADWLKGTAVHNARNVRLLLTTYIIDLTIVLESLFKIMLQRIWFLESITWRELKWAFEQYEISGSRELIHSNIFTIFRKEQRVLDPDSFRGMFSELVKGRRQDAGVWGQGPPTYKYDSLLGILKALR